jgi:cobyrinic acid a,c-diamide synthase
MRHLGLVTPREKADIARLVDQLSQVAEKHIDLKSLLKIARAAEPLEPVRGGASSKALKHGAKVRICYISDSAFSFYYPENLEVLEQAGAELIPLSALDAREIPPCDALYIGGGFPETHARLLSENRAFRDAIFRAAKSGLPIYAECGGLIYLAETLSWKGEDYPMAGVFPVRCVMEEKPQGHGYARVRVDGENPFFEKGAELRGHEFHYSRPDPWTVKSIFEVKRGRGCGEGRDGLVRWNTLGTYLHIHALGCPAWTKGIIRAATRYRKE